MKRYQVLLFIVSVIAALGLLCASFPQDGLKIGGIVLDFPGLGGVLRGNRAAKVMSPEELAAVRQRAVAEARFEEFTSSDPARFYMPGDDVSYFDALFESLENASETPVRIVHYGDSQIEEDRITGNIRRKLQECFGGCGQGYMPFRNYATFSMLESSSAELRRYMVFGPAESRASGSKYGPFGDFVRLDTAVTVSFRQVNSKAKGQTYFNRLTLVTGGVRGRMSVRCNGEKRVLEAGDGLDLVSFELPDSSTRASISVSGYGDVYGILLDGDNGVRMDNIPMRGCAGDIFTRMNSTQLKEYYDRENVRLIILQYGGNSVPYIRTAEAVSRYAASIAGQIRFLRKTAPDATILFIGPSDMSTTVKGRRGTYPILPSFIDSLRTAATSNGAAYWDIYGAMGGEGSMVEWVKAGLAGSDYVHFTPSGSRQMGEIFSGSFMLYYDYFKHRRQR